MIITEKKSIIKREFDDLRIAQDYLGKVAEYFFDLKTDFKEEVDFSGVRYAMKKSSKKGIIDVVVEGFPEPIEADLRGELEKLANQIINQNLAWPQGKDLEEIAHLFVPPTRPQGNQQNPYK